MYNKKPHLKQKNFDDIEVRETQMLHFGYGALDFPKYEKSSLKLNKIYK